MFIQHRRFSVKDASTPIRERSKRKRSKMQSVRVKLEARFSEDKQEGPRLASGGNCLINLETDEILSGLPSVASEADCTGDSLEPSDLSLSSDPHLEACIGDFPMPEELANLDYDFLAKSCNLGY